MNKRKFFKMPLGFCGTVFNKKEYAWKSWEPVIPVSMEKNSLKLEHLLYLKLLWDLEGAEVGFQLAVKQHVTYHRQFSCPAYRGVAFPIGSHKPRWLYSHLLPICTVHGNIFSSCQLFFMLGVGLLIFSTFSLVCVIHQFALSCLMWQLVIKEPSDCHLVRAHQLLSMSKLQLSIYSLCYPQVWRDWVASSFSSYLFSHCFVVVMSPSNLSTLCPVILCLPKGYRETEMESTAMFTYFPLLGFTVGSFMLYNTWK